MSHAAPAPAEPSVRAGHLAGAVVAAAVAALLAAGSRGLGLAGLVGAVALVQAGLIAGWLGAYGVPGRTTTLPRGVAVIAGAVAAVGDVALARRDSAGISALLGALALAFGAVVVQQLVRRTPRTDVAGGLAAAATLAVLVAALGGLIGLHRIAAGESLLRAAVLAVGAALVVGHLVDSALPVPAFAPGVARGGLGLVLGAAAATGVAVWLLSGVVIVTRSGAALFGVALGLAAGLVAVGAAFADVEEPAGEPGDRTRWGRRGLAGAVAAAVLPFALAAPVAYVVGQVVGG